MSKINTWYTLSFIVATALLVVVANMIHAVFLFFAGFFLMATIAMFIFAENTNE